jgi:hypothetical protein
VSINLPVLLIQGPLYRWHQGHRELGFQTMPPLGLGYIAAYLEAVGCEVRVLDMTAAVMRSEQQFREYLEQAPPSLIGISISPLSCAPPPSTSSCGLRASSPCRSWCSCCEESQALVRAISMV